MAGRDEALAGIVAGLVWPDQTDAELDAALAGVLTPEVYWVAASAEPDPPSGQVPGEPLLSWLAGNPPVSEVPRLAAAWERAVGRLGRADAIRLTVFSPESLVALREVGRSAALPVAAGLAVPGEGGFSWHCPVVVTTAGPAAQDLRTRLGALPLLGEYFVLAPPGDAADVCFVTSGAGDAAAVPPAGTVVAIGDAAPTDLLEAALGLSPVVAVGAPGEDLGWWPEVLIRLTGNLPLDCALAAVAPDTVVGGPGAALTATTLHPSYTPDGRWTGPTVTATFFATGRGGGDLEAEPADAEAEPEAGAEAGAGGQRAEPPELPVPTADRRRLVVEFRDGPRKVRTVLPPLRPLTLEVAIALPARGQPAGGVAVPDPGAPDEVVTLDVVVSGSPWLEPQHAQVAWPVHDVSQPSTSAVFSLTTPASGQSLTISISLLYQGRPLQQADVVAAVRELAVPGERVRVLVRATSTPPAPSLLATPAGVSLDATGSELRNTFTGGSVPLGSLSGVLDAFEQRISRTLGVDDAPESLSDPAALALLVDLARAGASLHDQLAGLGLDPPGAHGDVISLLVQPDSRVLPLELVYAGAVPRRTGVKLCEHVQVPPAPGEGCTRTSSRVVCPYAFWALNRTLVRSVVLPTGRALPAPAALGLRPVLFAASERADFGAPAVARPSDALAAACQRLFGQVDRVTSWTAWRREVSTLRPELLLLLAHTEVDAGEASLQIGRSSFLARPDISAAMLGGAPLVVLVACASAVAGDEFGTLPGTFTARGAAAVVGLLTKLSGPQGSRAAVAVLTALQAGAQGGPRGLGEALAQARRDLVAQGLLVGMMLVAHGEIDVVVGA